MRFRMTLLATLLFALMGSGQAQTPAAAKMLLTFIPNVQFSPFYVAASKGYFAEAGYDFTFEYINEPDVVDLIATGQENFGVVSGEQVILSAQGGREILFVYAWFQKYPIAVVANGALGIESAADLAGLRVGLPGRFGASYSGLTALLSAANLNESDLDLREIGFAAPDVFCLGEVDAATVYVNNEPLQIANRIADGACGDVSSITVLPVAASANLVANGLITSQAFAAEQADQVAAVVAAFDAGLRDAIANPAEAYLLSAEYVENLPLDEALRARLEALAAEQAEFLATAPSREEIAASRAALLEALQAEFDASTLLQFQVLLATIDLWDADALGRVDDDAWAQMAATLRTLGALTADLDLSSIHTDAYLPASD